jgi:hypothetical protein
MANMKTKLANVATFGMGKEVWKGKGLIGMMAGVGDDLEKEKTALQKGLGDDSTGLGTLKGVVEDAKKKEASNLSPDQKEIAGSGHNKVQEARRPDPLQGGAGAGMIMEFQNNNRC